MTAPVTIALDAMGGDHGADVVLPAALARVRADASLRLILVGDASLLQDRLAALNLPEQVRLQHASQQIGMADPPSQALRGKKDSSMRVGLELLRDGVAQAFVSSGNTGALVALSHYLVGMLPGIARPAIHALAPSLHGHTHLLDVGGNVDCQPERLLQFAVMGSAMARALDANERPRVGLLNVGAEAIKGNVQVRDADDLLRASGLNYIGYVEGGDIFCGEVDVVVCDGFIGNVSIKSSAGVVRLWQTRFMQEFRMSVYGRLALLAAAPVLRRFRRRNDSRRFNGANLLGLRQVVIKSHGSADAYSFEQAILRAKHAVQHDLPARIDQQLDAHFPDRLKPAT